MQIQKRNLVSVLCFLEGLGGALMEKKLVVGYKSRKLKPHEKKYVVYDLVLFVVIHALKMWRHYLLGKKFTLITNDIRL